MGGEKTSRGRNQRGVKKEMLGVKKKGRVKKTVGGQKKKREHMGNCTVNCKKCTCHVFSTALPVSHSGDTMARAAEEGHAVGGAGSGHKTICACTCVSMSQGPRVAWENPTATSE